MKTDTESNKLTRGAPPIYYPQDMKKLLIEKERKETHTYIGLGIKRQTHTHTLKKKRQSGGSNPFAPVPNHNDNCPSTTPLPHANATTLLQLFHLQPPSLIA